MRKLLAPFLILTALVACGPAEDPNKGDEIAALKKRIMKLENRVRNLEGRGRPGQGRPPRGKAPPRGKVPPGKGQPPGKAPAPTGPAREVGLEGDATSVMLTGNNRRFKLPGDVPVGEYTLLVAFGEDPLARKGTLQIPKGQGTFTVTCLKEKDACRGE